MSGLIANFPTDGIVTINRVILKPEYTVDDLQERVAFLCENVKTYHSDTGFVGGFVALNSGAVSNEGSTIGQPVESPMKGKEALIVTFWTDFENHEQIAPFRNLPALVPESAGPVRERQRGNRLRNAVVRQGLRP